MWGANPSSWGEALCLWDSSLLWDSASGMEIFGELASLHFLPISMWSFDHVFWRSSSASFQFFFEEYCPIYSCRVGVSRGKVSSWSSWASTLEHLSLPHPPQPLPCTCIFNYGRRFTFWIQINLGMSFCCFVTKNLLCWDCLWIKTQSFQWTSGLARSYAVSLLKILGRRPICLFGCM